MDDWPSEVKKALHSLGADRQLSTGAKLKQVLVKLAADPRAFDQFLETKGLRFSEFISGIEGVVVQKRGGSDMLVGFPGAEWPVPTPSSRSTSPRMQMRGDVYSALTTVSVSGYFYFPSQDKFVEGSTQQALDAVPLPKVTFSDLSSERKAFAESLSEQHIKEELLASLEQSANPLATFQRAITQANLLGQWHVYKFNLMRAKLEKWASENRIPILPSWYDDSSTNPDRPGPKLVLMRLADHMTDEEIRHLNVPFRAVEALFNSISRKT